MSDIKLPKLRVIDPNRPKKPKILLLSDDLQMHSGIATMSREFVLNSIDHFDWVQLGCAQEHYAHGQVFDISQAVNEERGIDHAYVKVYAHTGYGSANVVRELIALEKPDAILHFTDPRYWEWLYLMEHEIRTKHQIPLMYYNIWDCPPAPRWNKPFYQSCDLIMNITKQTHNLVKLVVEDDGFVDLDKGDPFESGKVNIAHVTHGIPDHLYFPIDETSAVWEEYDKFRTDFLTNHGVDFVVFWNNRNAARKHPGDVVLSYKTFCDTLPKEKAKRTALLMHTDIVDPNGTDLLAVKKNICPDYKVIFSTDKLPVARLNFFYNLADVTLNIASNEGFGLSNAESLMAGTPIIATVTGGLQDQMRFENDEGQWLDFDKNFTSNHAGTYTKHGEWAFPVFPSNRSLQGSIQTPYIFDDRVRFEDVALRLEQVYALTREQRKLKGELGRLWLQSDESKMTSIAMGANIAKNIKTCLENWQPDTSIRIQKINNNPTLEPVGIVINK